MLTGANEQHPWADESIALDCDLGTEATDDAMRIESGVCRYGVWSATVEHLSTLSRLSFTFWHDGLVATNAEENGTVVGHLGVAINGAVVVDVTEEIPSAPAWRTMEVDASVLSDLRDVNRIDIHLHNHGANHWGISPLLLEGEAIVDEE